MPHLKVKFRVCQNLLQFQLWCTLDYDSHFSCNYGQNFWKWTLKVLNMNFGLTSPRSQLNANSVHLFYKTHQIEKYQKLIHSFVKIGRPFIESFSSCIHSEKRLFHHLKFSLWLNPHPTRPLVDSKFRSIALDFILMYQRNDKRHWAWLQRDFQSLSTNYLNINFLIPVEFVWEPFETIISKKCEELDTQLRLGLDSCFSSFKWIILDSACRFLIFMELPTICSSLKIFELVS